MASFRSRERAVVRAPRDRAAVDSDAGGRDILRYDRAATLRGAKRRRLVAVLLTLAAVLATAAGPLEAEADRRRSRTLAEALLALGEQGLVIVFTSAVVAPELEVVEEPRATDPREILDELLRPHGLAVREGPGGVLAVVVDERDEPRAAPIAGEVVARGDGRTVAGATVRIAGSDLESETDAAGRFDFAAVDPGTYVLVAEAPGFLQGRLERVVVSAAVPRVVRIEVTPAPFVEDEIVVRPSQLSLLYERPQSALALDRDEIGDLPHLGDDLFRAISLLPGTGANDLTAQFSVHGGRRDEVEIRLDGQELYEAFHLSEYDNATSVVAARSLAGASLSTGNFLANWGDRMSGVLDLTTLEPSQPRRFTLGFGVLDLSGSGSGRFGDGRGGWMVHARRGSLDLAADAIGSTGPRYWDLLAKVEIESGVGRWGAHLLATGDDFKLDDREEESFERLATDYTKEYFWITHEVLAGRRLFIESQGSWSRLRRDRSGNGSEEKGEFELLDQRELLVWELSQAFSFEPSARRSTRLGWTARRYDARFDYSLQREPAFVIDAPFAEPRPNTIRFEAPVRGNHAALWASERRTFGGSLTAEAGLRFDRHDSTGEELWSPRLNLAWRLGERSVVRAGWGRFFQSHRPYELGVEDGVTELERAERSDHAVLGVETLPAAAPLGVEAVRIEVYRRDVHNPRRRGDNLLEAHNYFQEVEPDRVLLAPERGEATGVEVVVRGQAAHRLRWWVAYSLARSEERIAGATAPRALDPRHTLALDLALALPADWSLNLAWRYHTGWPTTGVETLELESPEDPEAEPETMVRFDTLRGARLPEYHRFDLRASRRWPTRRGSWTLYFDVQNLTDQKNLAGFGLVVDAEEGASLEAEYWPGVFPSFGLVWEF